MARGRKPKSDLIPSDINTVTPNDLTDRLFKIQKEQEKLEDEREHILSQIKNIESKEMLKQLAFDKIVLFKHKKLDTYGLITGMFKDSVIVTLCDSKGKELSRPEGAKRFSLEAKLGLEEIIRIL